MGKDAARAFSRRGLLGALGAWGAAGLSGAVFAQSGGCRDGYERPRCPLPVEKATVPIKDVFASTGWKTVAMESFTIDVADYQAKRPPFMPP